MPELTEQQRTALVRHLAELFALKEWHITDATSQLPRQPKGTYMLLGEEKYWIDKGGRLGKVSRFRSALPMRIVWQDGRVEENWNPLTDANAALKVARKTDPKEGYTFCFTPWNPPERQFTMEFSAPTHTEPSNTIETDGPTELETICLACARATGREG